MECQECNYATPDELCNYSIYSICYASFYATRYYMALHTTREWSHLCQTCHLCSTYQHMHKTTSSHVGATKDMTCSVKECRKYDISACRLCCHRISHVSAGWMLTVCHCHCHSDLVCIITVVAHNNAFLMFWEAAIIHSWLLLSNWLPLHTNVWLYVMYELYYYDLRNWHDIVLVFLHSLHKVACNPKCVMEFWWASCGPHIYLNCVRP